MHYNFSLYWALTHTLHFADEEFIGHTMEDTKKWDSVS